MGRGPGPLDERQRAAQGSREPPAPWSRRSTATFIGVATVLVVGILLVAWSNLESWFLDELPAEREVAREVGLADGVTRLGETVGGGSGGANGLSVGDGTQWEIYVAVPEAMEPTDGLQLPDFVAVPRTRESSDGVDLPGSTASSERLLAEGRRGDCWLTVAELPTAHYREIRAAGWGSELDSAPADSVVLQISADCG